MVARIYVAAPYEDAMAVRDVHALLRRLGFDCTSSWAENARGPEDLTSLSFEAIRSLAEQNDADVMAADLVLVRARLGAGGEMFAEARWAIEKGKRVFWVGRKRILSAYRLGVVLFDDIDDALAALVATRGAA